MISRIAKASQTIQSLRRKRSLSPRQASELAQAEAELDEAIATGFVNDLCATSLADRPPGMLGLSCFTLAKLVQMHPDKDRLLLTSDVRRPIMNLIGVYMASLSGSAERGSPAAVGRKRAARHVVSLVEELWRAAAAFPAVGSTLLARASGPAATAFDETLVLCAVRHMRFSGKTGQSARRAVLVAASLQHPDVDFLLLRGRTRHSSAAEAASGDAGADGAPGGKAASDRPSVAAIAVTAAGIWLTKVEWQAASAAATATSGPVQELCDLLRFCSCLAHTAAHGPSAPPLPSDPATPPDDTTRPLCLGAEAVALTASKLFGQDLPGKISLLLRTQRRAKQAAAASDAADSADAAESAGGEAAAPSSDASSPSLAASRPAAAPALPPAGSASSAGPPVPESPDPAASRPGPGAAVSPAVLQRAVAAARASTGTALVVAECCLHALSAPAAPSRALLHACVDALLLAPTDPAHPGSGPRTGHLLLSLASTDRPDLAAPACRLLTLVLAAAPPRLASALRSLPPPPDEALSTALAELTDAAAPTGTPGTAAPAAGRASAAAALHPRDAAACPALTACLLLPEATGRLLTAADGASYRQAAVSGLLASAARAAAGTPHAAHAALQQLLGAPAPADPFGSLYAAPAAAAESDAAIGGGEHGEFFARLARGLVSAAVGRVARMLQGDEHSALAGAELLSALLRALAAPGRARLLFGEDGSSGVVARARALWREVRRRGAAREGFELALAVARREWGAALEPADEELLGSAPEEDLDQAAALLAAPSHRALVDGAARSIEFLKELAAALGAIAAVESAGGGGQTEAL